MRHSARHRLPSRTNDLPYHTLGPRDHHVQKSTLNWYIQEGVDMDVSHNGVAWVGSAKKMGDIWPVISSLQSRGQPATSMCHPHTGHGERLVSVLICR